MIDGAGGATKLTWEEVQKWQPADGVLWVHFDYTEPATREWLAQGSGLDELVSEALSAEETRPRATALGEGLLNQLASLRWLMTLTNGVAALVMARTWSGFIWRTGKLFSC